MLSALALLTVVVALLAGTVPAAFGYEGFVVLSGSMEPAMGVGDLAVVGPAKPQDLMQGDVVTYRTAQRPDVVVTHRLVGISIDDEGKYNFQTKGDANNTPDSVTVDQGAVVGRVTYTIPKIGYLVEFSKRPEGKIALIGIPGLLLALDYLLKRRRQEPAVAEIRPAQGRAAELLARGRIAYQNGAYPAAADLFDEAIGVDPHLDEAWLMKSNCLPAGTERITCLRAGLAVNPSSRVLKGRLD